MTAMSGKVVIVAHRNQAVRERFVAALHDAGHRAAGVETASETRAALDAAGGLADLALVDASLPHDVVAALASVSGPADRRPAIVVFGSTVAGASQARALAAAGVRAYVNDFTAPALIVSSLAPHLFHDNFNRRASPRVAISIGVSCRVGSVVSAATTLNIGRGGMALRVLTQMPAGTNLTLRFRLPAIARDIEADARVCWTDAQLGLGAQFERIAPEDQAAIDAFVEQHAGSATA
jgi:CheY-like chemotaxis protein